MDFLRADFGVLRRLIERVPGKAVLKGKIIQPGWMFFQRKILKTHVP